MRNKKINTEMVGLSFNNHIMKISLVAILLVIFAVPAFAQDEAKDEMSMEQYETELTTWQSREESANTELSRLEKEIAALRIQITDVERKIVTERKLMFDLMSTTEQEMEDYKNMLAQLKSDIEGLNDLSPEDVEAFNNQLGNIQVRLDNLNESDLAALEENKDLLNEVEGMLAKHRVVIPEPRQIEQEEVLADYEIDDDEDYEVPAAAKLERKTYDPNAGSYTVIRGDNLWRISARPGVYNDPLQWMKLYSSNRDQIKDPNLIYVSQIFSVPRAEAWFEHWVKPGESLTKIASEKYNNPFAWTRIYKANQDILESADKIYPHTILLVPQKKGQTKEDQINL